MVFMCILLKYRILINLWRLRVFLVEGKRLGVFLVEDRICLYIDWVFGNVVKM